MVYLVQWVLFLHTCQYASENKKKHIGLAPLLFLADSTVCLLNYNLSSRIQLIWVPPSHIIFSLFMETVRDMGWPVGLCHPSTENRAGWSWQCFPGLCSDHLAMTQGRAVPFKSWCYHLADFTARIHFWPLASSLLVSSPSSRCHMPFPHLSICLMPPAPLGQAVSGYKLHISSENAHILKSIVHPASSLRTNESCCVLSTCESWSILDT